MRVVSGDVAAMICCGVQRLSPSRVDPLIVMGTGMECCKVFVGIFDESVSFPAG
jgi:hypothetical protein